MLHRRRHDRPGVGDRIDHNIARRAVTGGTDIAVILAVAVAVGVVFARVPMVVHVGVHKLFTGANATEGFIGQRTDGDFVLVHQKASHAIHRRHDGLLLGLGRADIAGLAGTRGGGAGVLQDMLREHHHGCFNDADEQQEVKRRNHSKF